MATTYGGWVNHGRIMWVWSVPTPGPSTTSVYATVTAYLQMDSVSSISGLHTRYWSGHWGSGSAQLDFGYLGPSQTRQIVTGSGTPVTLTDSPQTISFSASVQIPWGLVSSTLSVTIPARIPRTPIGLTIARLSDTQHTSSWIRDGVYSSVAVQRSADGSAWFEVGRPAGNPASFTDTTTSANQRYYYRVASITSGGQSSWSDAAGPIFTTPAAPATVAATRSGVNIVVEASGLPPFASSYDVRDGETVVAEGVALPWTDVAPSPAVPHTYRVRAVAGALAGAWSPESNTVQLLTAPNAPTNLVPNGGVSATEAPVKLQWVHNPVDTTAQSAYEVRYRLGVGAWTVLSGTLASSCEASLGLGTYEWQVRTKGQHADWSPWSTSATVEVVNRPGVALLHPDATHDRQIVDVNWSWFQAQSRPQSAWQLQLLDSDHAVLEALSGDGGAAAQRLNTRVADGAVYTVQVRCATGNLWSEWATSTFEVVYTKPADPLVVGNWDENLGGNSLAIEGGASEEALPTVAIDVERSVDGSAWEPVLEGAEPETAIVDWQCLSNGVTRYRVTAYTEDGASAEVVVPVTADSGALWLSGSIGYRSAIRLPYDPGVKIDAGRTRSVERYEGRTRGVAYAGEQVSLAIDVSGTLLSEEGGSVQIEALGELVQDPHPIHLYRDPDGRRVYGSLSSVSLSREAAEVWSYGFHLEETDH